MARIAYISNATIPSRAANSIHVMKMCQAFARNGNAVTLLAPDRFQECETNVKDVYGYYGVDRCFEIEKVTWSYSLTGKTYLYGFLAAYRSLRLDPDLVYSRHVSGAYFAAKMGLSVIFESHAPVEQSGALEALLFRRMLAGNRLKRLVVITQALKRHYEGAQAKREHLLMVAPDGADVLSNQCRSVDLPNAGKRLQVGYLGHLYAGKGMEIVAKLADACSWADFHVVGGTEDDLASWKTACSSLSNLTFYGHVAHSAVAAYLKAFDVLLLPNQCHVAAHGNGGPNIADWTSPLKLFEYMSATKPIVASDLAVLREVLRDEENALLCDSKRIADWQAALERLASDRTLRLSLGERAHQDFIRHYTWQARASIVLDRLDFSGAPGAPDRMRGES